jgi:hypothetical protein
MAVGFLGEYVMNWMSASLLEFFINGASLIVGRMTAIA